jgi:hypothetical protein
LRRARRSTMWPATCGRACRRSRSNALAAEPCGSGRCHTTPAPRTRLPARLPSRVRTVLEAIGWFRPAVLWRCCMHACMHNERAFAAAGSHDGVWRLRGAQHSHHSRAGRHRHAPGGASRQLHGPAAGATGAASTTAAAAASAGRGTGARAWRVTGGAIIVRWWSHQAVCRLAGPAGLRVAGRYVAAAAPGGWPAADGRLGRRVRLLPGGRRRRGSGWPRLHAALRGVVRPRAGALAASAGETAVNGHAVLCVAPPPIDALTQMGAGVAVGAGWLAAWLAGRPLGATAILAVEGQASLLRQLRRAAPPRGQQQRRGHQRSGGTRWHLTGRPHRQPHPARSHRAVITPQTVER